MLERGWKRAAGGVGVGLVLGVVGSVLGAAGRGVGQDVAAQVADPLRQYTTHVVATHYLRGQAYEVHHYFKPLRDGVLQGLVFREATGGAGLLEVEWAIGREVWERLPDWQKEYWHPLAPAVDAGRVRLPELGAAEEREMLQTVRGLYAQTFNLAGLEEELPVGLEGVAMVTHITRAEMLRAMRAETAP